jgi:hypothetical protein
MERKGGHHHAEWASLRYAAWLGVRFPQGGANSVVVLHRFMEAPVSIEDRDRKARRLEQVIQKFTLYLVEALPNVSTSSSEGLSSEPGQLEVKAQEIPGILSTTRCSRAREKL